MLRISFGSPKEGMTAPIRKLLEFSRVGIGDAVQMIDDAIANTAMVG